ncbi:MAG: ATP-binding protein [Breznakibacter sp.]
MILKTRQIEIKLVLGYLSFFIVAAIALVFTYRQIVSLTEPDPHSQETGKKIAAIGQTFANLLEAETHGQLFLQGSNSQTLRKYLTLMGELSARIDSLALFAEDSQQLARIDTIEYLLKRKISNMLEINRIRASQNTDDFYLKAIQAIEAVNNSIREVQRVRRSETVTLDSTFVKQDKKRGFLASLFGRKPDSTLHVTVSRQMTIDTVVSNVSSIPYSQTKQAVQDAWTDRQRQTRMAATQIKQREVRIMVQSAEITSQLRRILTDFESEEFARGMQQMSEREAVIAKTSMFLVQLGVVSVTLILLFLFFTMRDVTRSRRYRMQLEAANDYANQLLKRRETLLHSVTHDIKSPLSAIMGFVEIMEMNQSDERQRYYLSHMKSSSNYILQLVNNLLDLWKLENRKMPIETVEFNPNLLIEDVFHSYMPQAQKRNLRLSCKTSAGLNTFLLGDALKIKQILNNLVSNAVKYTMEGTVEVQALLSTANDQLEITVTDTGMGMTDAERERLFDEFTRFSSASGIEGTGLGMTITLKLVNLLGGSIQVKSEPGKGSCISVQIPIRPKKYDNSRDSSSKERSFPIPSGNGKKVWMIDDDPSQLQMGIAALKQLGIDVEGTDDVQCLMDNLAQHNAIMVFSDVQMPRVSGMELVRAIRQSSDPYLQQLPVVALSAATNLTEADYCANGFSAFLSKPYSPTQLHEMVKRFGGNLSLLDVSPDMQVPRNGYSLGDILKFADNDVQSARRIVRSLTDDMRRHGDELAELLEKKDTEGLARLAHKMLPTFKQLHAVKALPHLEALERKNEQPLAVNDISIHVNAVVDECKELRRWLGSHAN